MHGFKWNARFPAPVTDRTGAVRTRTRTRELTAPTPERSARGEGIPPVSDASFTKETHARSLTQLPILGNMRQWTEASGANSEVRGGDRRPSQKQKNKKYTSPGTSYNYLRKFTASAKSTQSVGRSAASAEGSLQLPYAAATPPWTKSQRPGVTWVLSSELKSRCRSS